MMATFCRLSSEKLPCSVPSPLLPSPLPPPSPSSRSVAIIGAGAAGLVAARELLRHGHHVVVFEQHRHGVGGVWRYTPETDDPLDACLRRSSVHSSMYLSLRTNLPREVMGYFDFPFLPKKQSNRDPRRYPCHQEVLYYLEDFAHQFNLLPFIRFGRRVTRVDIRKTVVADGASVFSLSDVSPNSLMEHLESSATRRVQEMQWSVVSEAVDEHLNIETDLFDAVIICNGHYFQPKFASIPGIEKWPGKQFHSHNYRVPDPFFDQVVVVIGNSSSGMDISREIAKVAKAVHWVGRTWPSHVDLQQPAGPSHNIILHLMVIAAQEDGVLTFDDGISVTADAILYCTGYGYSMPFLQLEGIVNVDDDHVGPLYQHVYPPLLAPFLSFVGLPFKVIPFPLMELQSKWIAMVLSGELVLPSKDDMKRCIYELYGSIKAKGLPKSKIHDLSSYQFEYDDWLATQCGSGAVEDWRRKIYSTSSYAKRALPDTYRDEWDDEDLHEIVIAQLVQLQVATNFFPNVAVGYEDPGVKVFIGDVGYDGPRVKLFIGDDSIDVFTFGLSLLILVSIFSGY